MSALPVPISVEPAKGVVPQPASNTPYDKTLAGLLAEYTPHTSIERQLCAQIADCWCRLERTSQLETDLFNSYSDFVQIADVLLKLTRYRNSIEREWHKCIDQLRSIQKARQKADPNPANQQPKPPKKESPLDTLLKQYLYAPVSGRKPTPVPHRDLDDDEDEPESD